MLNLSPCFYYNFANLITKMKVIILEPYIKIEYSAGYYKTSKLWRVFVFLESLNRVIAPKVQ